MIGLLLLASALAHHDAAVSQVGPQAGPSTSDAEVVGEPTLELGLGSDAIAFTRTLRGAQPFPTAGAVDVHTLTPSVRLRLPSGTAFALRLPVGAVQSRADEKGATFGVAVQVVRAGHGLRQLRDGHREDRAGRREGRARQVRRATSRWS